MAESDQNRPPLNPVDVAHNTLGYKEKIELEAHRKFFDEEVPAVERDSAGNLVPLMRNGELVLLQEDQPKEQYQHLTHEQLQEELRKVEAEATEKWKVDYAQKMQPKLDALKEVLEKNAKSEAQFEAVLKDHPEFSREKDGKTPKRVDGDGKFFLDDKECDRINELAKEDRYNIKLTPEQNKAIEEQVKQETLSAIESARIGKSVAPHRHKNEEDPTLGFLNESLDDKIESHHTVRYEQDEHGNPVRDADGHDKKIITNFKPAFSRSIRIDHSPLEMEYDQNKSTERSPMGNFIEGRANDLDESYKKLPEERKVDEAALWVGLKREYDNRTDYAKSPDWDFNRQEVGKDGVTHRPLQDQFVHDQNLTFEAWLHAHPEKLNQTGITPENGFKTDIDQKNEMYARMLAANKLMDNEAVADKVGEKLADPNRRLKETEADYPRAQRKQKAQRDMNGLANDFQHDLLIGNPGVYHNTPSPIRHKESDKDKDLRIGAAYKPKSTDEDTKIKPLVLAGKDKTQEQANLENATNDATYNYQSLRNSLPESARGEVPATTSPEYKKTQENHQKENKDKGVDPVAAQKAEAERLEKLAYISRAGKENETTLTHYADSLDDQRQRLARQEKDDKRNQQFSSYAESGPDTSAKQKDLAAQVNGIDGQVKKMETTRVKVVTEELKKPDTAKLEAEYKRAKGKEVIYDRVLERQLHSLDRDNTSKNHAKFIQEFEKLSPEKQDALIEVYAKEENIRKEKFHDYLTARDANKKEPTPEKAAAATAARKEYDALTAKDPHEPTEITADFKNKVAALDNPAPKAMAQAEAPQADPKAIGQEPTNIAGSTVGGATGNKDMAGKVVAGANDQVLPPKREVYAANDTKVNGAPPPMSAPQAPATSQPGL